MPLPGAPDAWPGVRLTYAFLGGPARLRLSVSCDPADAGSDAAAYDAVAAQLADPSTALTLRASVLPTGPVGDGESLRAWLAAFLARVAPGADAVAEPLDLPIDPAGLRDCTDLLALDVTLTAALPGAPRLTVRPGIDGDLTAFAQGFAAAFDGFDGGTGTARLAVRAGRLWVLRCSATYGVTAAVTPGRAVCFALPPLNTSLVDGVAAVPAYDDDLVPTMSPRAFRGIDLDTWARDALGWIDTVFAREVGGAIAALDEAAYTDLVRARAVLAGAVAGSLRPVLLSDEEDGDARAARAELERVATTSLSAAYAVTSVVQVPVEVTSAAPVAGLRLSGSVGAEAGAALPAGVTTGDAALPLVPPSGWLTFLVPVPASVDVPHVALPLTYRVTSVAHDESGRLSLVPPGGPVELPLGTVDVPVLARAYPAPPVAVTQTASPDPAGDGIADHLRWAYEAEVALPGVAAQDALWVDVAYNAAPGAPVLAAESGGVRALFQALASFVAAWPRLAPHVDALPGLAAGSPAPVVAAVRDQVQRVAGAWAALGTRGADPGPAADTDRYVVDFAARAAGTLVVRAPGARVPAWPLVDGRAPRATAAGRAEYDYAPAATLTLRWPGLDLRARQSARSTYWVVRDAGERVDPAFGYRTPDVAFQAPVVPLIEVPPVAPLAPDPTSLCRSLCDALAPLAAVAISVSPERSLTVRIGYSYALAGATRAEEAVLLAERVPLAPGGSCADCDSAPPPTLAGVCRELAASCQAWWEGAQPTGRDALLELRVVLFAEVAGERLPVVTFDRVPVTVPPGWWPVPRN